MRFGYHSGVTRIYAKSANSKTARELLESLQKHFVRGLEAVAAQHGETHCFEPISWLRDEGRHGGGERYALGAPSDVFNGASVNVSSVHYDDVPDKKLRSADALSTIIHPSHPRAPSVHLHFSWTEMRDGSGYWRMMADLNPAIEDSAATQKFAQRLKELCPEHYQEAETQGAKYFYIPALGRHRGVTHFYLEQFSSGDFAADAELCRRLCEGIMDAYCDILRSALQGAPEPTPQQRETQLTYHTLYLFQVLTLDRGTTSGLLVHDQNDLGIMGSIPAFVDRELLASWADKVVAPQDELVKALADALEDRHPSPVTSEVRLRLAQTVRAHYQKYPEALRLQATGNTIPPTVDNHLG
jgi:coproporphyrinogen III oxidase